VPNHFRISAESADRPDRHHHSPHRLRELGAVVWILDVGAGRVRRCRGEPQLIALDRFLCAHVASTCESYEHNINIDTSWLLRMRN